MDKYHAFTLRLQDTNTISNKIEDDMYAAQCSDALLYSIGNHVLLDFNRKGKNFLSAVLKAYRDLKYLGYNSKLYIKEL